MEKQLKCSLTIIACVLIVVGIAPAAFSKKQSKTRPVDGAAVFKQSCASCHAGGGNSVNPKKPLAESQKLESLPVFKQYLQNPIGHMPYYKHVVSDRKTLQALYEYCKTLKPSEAS